MINDDQPSLTISNPLSTVTIVTIATITIFTTTTDRASFGGTVRRMRRILQAPMPSSLTFQYKGRSPVY